MWQDIKILCSIFQAWGSNGHGIELLYISWWFGSFVVAIILLYLIKLVSFLEFLSVRCRLEPSYSLIDAVRAIFNVVFIIFLYLHFKSPSFEFITFSELRLLQALPSI